MTLHWPQLLYLGLVVLGLGIEVSRHGEPRTSRYNFWSALIGNAIVTATLYAGGFFG